MTQRQYVHKMDFQFSERVVESSCITVAYDACTVPLFMKKSNECNAYRVVSVGLVLVFMWNVSLPPQTVLHACM